MESSLTYEILVILALIIANGYFALSEFSIIASRKSKLVSKSENGSKSAKAALELHNKPEKFLATVQVGITLFATIAGVLGGVTLVRSIEGLLLDIPISNISSSAKTISVVIVAILITIISVVIGELVPKYLALSNPEKYAQFVARPITLFIKLTSFFSNLLSKSATLILKLFGISTSNDQTVISEDEINQMIFDGKQKGVFDETEEKLIKSVFDFADSTVRRAMTPRIDVEALELYANPKDIFHTIVENGYSRYPIFENNIDKIVGVLYTKDIIIHKLNPERIILSELIREPLFIPDSMLLSKMLNIFQKKKVHIAIVLDEFGGTAGIITLEDILEELVGEIQDEYDVEREPLVKHSDNIVFAEGSVWVGAINELLNAKLPEDKAETIAGLVIDYVGAIPKKDYEIIIENVRIVVLEEEDNRLTRLKVELLPESQTDNEKKE